jgi:phosphoglycolate phosphatase
MSHGQAIIFDWDGTLMDSEAAIVAAMREAYRQLQFPAPSYAEVRDIIGLSLDDALASLSPHIELPARCEIIANYRLNYTTRSESPKLFPGVERVLTELYQRGYALAVATGKSHKGLKKSLAGTNLGDIFSAMRTGDQCESKPSPAMLNEIIHELGIEAESALMIGDTEFDLAMAHSAGVACAAVSYGAHDVQRLKLFKPVFTLDKFEELPDKLDKHFHCGVAGQ